MSDPKVPYAVQTPGSSAQYWQVGVGETLHMEEIEGYGLHAPLPYIRIHLTGSRHIDVPKHATEWVEYREEESEARA